MRRSMLGMMGLLALVSAADHAAAQPLGTVQWQLQPYCNVLVLDIIREGNVFRLQGYDDQCGQTGGMWSVVSGTAVLRGSEARIGLTYTFPGAPLTEGARLRATINLATFSGQWDDNGNDSGAFMFAPNGAGGGGGFLRVRSPLPNLFVHVAASFNSIRNITCVSHPLMDGNPNALIFVAVNRGLNSGVRPDVPSSFSVYYDDNGTGLNPPYDDDVWCISRNDNQPVPANAAFTLRAIVP